MALFVAKKMETRKQTNLWEDPLEKYARIFYPCCVAGEEYDAHCHAAKVLLVHRFDVTAQSQFLSRQSLVRCLLTLLFAAVSVLSPAVTVAQPASFRVLAFFTAQGEPAHIAIARQP